MRNWVLMVASVVAAAPATAATLTRGPYLQLLTETSVTVVWNTDVPAACSLAIHPMDGSTTVLRGGSGTVCAVSVDGLVPGGFYGYVPRADNVALRGESVFQTDDATRSFSFVVVGDSGSGGDAQLAVRDRMVGTAPDFLLHTGDMIYEAGEADQFNPRFFKPYEQLLRRAVFWPCLGNHDYRTASGGPWRDAFYTPANNPAQSENYYSFNRGNAHVVVLNSNQSTSPGSAQYNWLEQDLAASQAPWKFVAFHHTIYSNGAEHGSNLTIRRNLVPLFDRYGVDIVFMGHDHDYERTHPLRGDMVVSPTTGTTYVTTGGGGKDLYDVGSSWFTAYAESAHHFTRVLVNGNLLFLQMIRADGEIRDRFIINKGSTTVPPPPTTTTIRATTTTTTSPPFTLVTTTTTTRPPTTTLPPLPPGAITMTPIADTYIEAGLEGTWDHGGCTHMDVDKKPAGVTYLKFDVRRAPQPITRAILQLYVTNTSPDGGGVYPLPFSGWIEGTGNGIDATSAAGAGLKWVDVDTNGDGKLDAFDQNLLVPDPTKSVATLGPVTSTQTIRLDVTAAVRSAGIITLAIMNDSSDGTTFSSREAPRVDRRPVLALWTGASPPPPPPPPPPPAAPTTTTTTTTRPPTSATSSTVPAPTTTRPPTTTTTTLRPFCGDGRITLPEQCDGRADSVCPGRCQSDCTCAPPDTSAFACLSEPGPVLKASGTWGDRWVEYSLAEDTKIDARTFTALASPSNLYPVRFGGGNDLCLAGATVLGQYNRNYSWAQMHDNYNNAGVVSKNKFATIDGVRIDNVTDGYRPENGPFTIRQSWFTYVRDDCVENDHVFGGLIEDSLFEECYVGISERPTDPIIAEGFDGRNQLLTISKSLIGLVKMPGPRGGSSSDMGHGIMFKWSDYGTKLALHDNVFLAETASMSPSSMGVPANSLVSCSNNTMVWLGSGDYPVKLPSCFTITRDRSVWDRAVADWKARHPQVVQ